MEIHQRLGDHDAALRSFAEAHASSPEQPDVSREAGIEAIEVGDGAQAVRFCHAAIAASPDDPGLLANLALALLIDRKPAEALDVASQALRANPADPITSELRSRIEAVVAGTRPRPRTSRDLLR